MTPTPAFLHDIRLARGLWLLIGGCVLIEAVLLGADHGLWGSVRWRVIAYQYAAFWAGLLHGWRPNFTGQSVTMFLTAPFLHAGPSHLIGNMIGLAVLGRIAGDRLGGRGLAILLGLSALGGGLVFGLLTRNPAPMVGSSGAIFGLAGAWIVWQAQDRKDALRKALFRQDQDRDGDQGGPGPLSRRDLWPMIWPALAQVLGLVAINLVMLVGAKGNLAWEAHLGGTLAGAIVAALLRPAPPR